MTFGCATIAFFESAAEAKRRRRGRGHEGRIGLLYERRLNRCLWNHHRLHDCRLLARDRWLLGYDRSGHIDLPRGADFCRQGRRRRRESACASGSRRAFEWSADCIETADVTDCRETSEVVLAIEAAQIEVFDAWLRRGCRCVLRR